jgi:hypothetical protein
MITDNFIAEQYNGHLRPARLQAGEPQVAASSAVRARV